MIATVDDCISWRPCHTWPEKRIREIAGGKDRWTAREVLGLRGQIPDQDLVWLLLHKELIPEPVLWELACRFVEAVLPLYERSYPNDRRPHQAIETRRRWLRGEASVEELAAAWAAAWSAAWSAAGSAAYAAGAAARSAAYAAGAAARSAAGSAAYAAGAAGSAAYAAQLDMIARVIEEMEQ